MINVNENRNILNRERKKIEELKKDCIEEMSDNKVQPKVTLV